ncbi:AbrB/MazE/SpoVT family DNA-binding domain-containing protein [Spirosoma validum]|uniref:AbrB/MazE/SpoVT family DNA-binding domain-containing protein n=1 Tax=Spirosoma validum TaxID=2771355 RepID=A0A927AXU2_9BACT|nr:AbrB/MazE/SpoVT family DNA-binding domain-containing protein [Spirosoma validum]MBD2751769.1 AbrB/MazE/SpoVT family DNA-binding domain-containing protein [Spirosoma validum]
MRLAVVSIGNSKGIRIPKAVLDKYQISNSVEVEMREDELVLRPIRKPREGWEEAFKQMHANGDDRLLIPDVFDDETWEEW